MYTFNTVLSVGDLSSVSGSNNSGVGSVPFHNLLHKGLVLKESLSVILPCLFYSGESEFSTDIYPQVITDKQS